MNGHSNKAKRSLGQIKVVFVFSLDSYDDRILE